MHFSPRLLIGFFVLVILAAAGANALPPAPFPASTTPPLAPPSIVFTDNFNTYTSNYLVIDPTTDHSNWTLNFDANSISLDTSYLKDSNSAFKVVSKALQSDNNRTSIQTFHPPIDIHDYNAAGRAYYWVKVDGNASNIYRADIRMGDDQQHYNSWFNTAPWGGPIIPGYNLIRFDLNASILTPGFPSTFYQDTFLEVSLHTGKNNGTPADYNYTLNKIWVEKSPNAFNNRWAMIEIHGNPRGWALPVKEGTRYAMNLASTDDSTLDKHARVSIPELSGSAVNIADYNLHLSADIKQMDTNRGTRVFFDYVDSTNYSGVYIEDINITRRAIGIEQIIGGVRQFNQTEMDLAYGSYNTLRFDLVGTGVSVYVDNVLIHTGNIASRIDGSIGIDSQGGRTLIKNVRLVLNNQ